MSLNLNKPPRLHPGDKVATVSLSWGGAGDPELLWRYHQGKKQLEEHFGLRVVEMNHTLRGSSFAYKHPEARAEDLMNAFADPTIKGIFSCIGGDDSVRLLPYVDLSVLRNNPKVFIGYSDTTASHLLCLKAGISSFYGPSILAEMAENGGIPEYTAAYMRKALFDSEPIGPITPSPTWTSEYLPWLIENKDKRRKFQENHGYEVLQGTGTVQGHLIGGCIEVLEMAKQTDLWPNPEAFDGAILFLETSEDKVPPMYVEYWLRNYGVQGILGRIKGMIWGKPYDNRYYEEYKQSIRKVLAEFGQEDLPVLCNLSFGHTAPMFTIPYGVMAQLNCNQPSLAIVEAGVL